MVANVCGLLGGGGIGDGGHASIASGMVLKVSKWFSRFWLWIQLCKKQNYRFRKPKWRVIFCHCNQSKVFWTPLHCRATWLKCHFRNDSKNYLTFLVHPSRYIWLNKPGGWRRTWFLEMNFCLKVSSVTGHLCIQVNCLFTFSWTQWWTNLIWSFCCPFKKNSSIKFYVF